MITYSAWDQEKIKSPMTCLILSQRVKGQITKLKLVAKLKRKRRALVRVRRSSSISWRTHLGRYPSTVID